MERAAFARARSFLNYHPVAKWLAICSAVGTALLYVALLMLLGLFVDLVITGGQVPAYQNLPAPEQQQFKELVQKPLDKFPTEGTFDAAVQKQWQAHLKQLGTGLDKDTSNVTRALHLRNELLDLGVPREHADELTLVCLRDPSKLPAKDYFLRLELLWRVHLDRLLRDTVGAPVVRERFKAELENNTPVELAATRNLPNLGVLGLVVRTQHRWDGWLVSFVASWNPWMWAYGSTVYLSGLLALAVLLGLLRGGLMFANGYTAAQATAGAATRLRRAVYHHTYRLGTLAFRALGPSEAVGVSTRHLEAVHDGLYAWLTVVFREPVKFGLLLAFALLVNFWLALAFLLFSLLVWLIGGQVAAYFRREGRASAHKAANQLALMQESLMLMRLVKVYLMELFNQSRVERQLASYARAQGRRYRGEAIYRPLMVFLGLLAALLLLYIAGLVVLSGQLGMTSALVLATALVSLYWPMVNWLDNRRYLRRARESAVVLFNFLERPGGVGQVVEAEFLPALGKYLEFDNVTLLEPGTGRKLLQGVSLTIQSGQRVAVVGPDDMEKHALVYLIPRFLDPNSGEIRIDRKNLRWVTLDSLRAQIAIVLQHNLVFNDTVANNIGCGDPTYPLPRIIEAAKLAHAHQFIQKLPKGYETPIGEMGQALKIGEQFRIALARAILRDPALMIIEEPLTPLDDDTKALLDDTFARVLAGRTTIFLPHRLSTIRNCDRVFLLYNGQVEAAGDHKELLAQSELYRHLQYLEFNEFAGLVSPQTIVSARTA
jgi:ATP-binding cassette subfamily B protein